MRTAPPQMHSSTSSSAVGPTAVHLQLQGHAQHDLLCRFAAAACHLQLQGHFAWHAMRSMTWGGLQLLPVCSPRPTTLLLLVLAVDSGCLWLITAACYRLVTSFRRCVPQSSTTCIAVHRTAHWLSLLCCQRTLWLRSDNSTCIRHIMSRTALPAVCLDSCCLVAAPHPPPALPVDSLWTAAAFAAGPACGQQLPVCSSPPTTLQPLVLPVGSCCPIVAPHLPPHSG